MESSRKIRFALYTFVLMYIYTYKYTKETSILKKVGQSATAFSSLVQFTNQTSPCGLLRLDHELTFQKTDDRGTVSHGLLQVHWTTNELRFQREGTFRGSFSPRIIDALSSSVFRAVTIHSCTCDRTAGGFHYAQLGENAYFNLSRGE